MCAILKYTFYIPPAPSATDNNIRNYLYAQYNDNNRTWQENAYYVEHFIKYALCTYHANASHRWACAVRSVAENNLNPYGIIYNRVYICKFSICTLTRTDIQICVMFLRLNSFSSLRRYIHNVSNIKRNDRKTTPNRVLLYAPHIYVYAVAALSKSHK